MKICNRAIPVLLLAAAGLFFSSSPAGASNWDEPETFPERIESLDAWTCAGYGKGNERWDADISYMQFQYERYDFSSLLLSAGRQLPESFLHGKVGFKAELPYLRKNPDGANSENGIGDLAFFAWREPFELNSDLFLKVGGGLQFPTADEDIVGPDNDLDIVFFTALGYLGPDLQLHADYEIHFGEDEMIYHLNLLAAGELHPKLLGLAGLRFENPTEYGNDEIQALTGTLLYAMKDSNVLSISIGIGLNNEAPDFSYGISLQVRFE